MKKPLMPPVKGSGGINQIANRIRKTWSMDALQAGVAATTVKIRQSWVDQQKARALGGRAWKEAKKRPDISAARSAAAFGLKQAHRRLGRDFSRRHALDQRRVSSDYDESKHPRDDNGKWTGK